MSMRRGRGEKEGPRQGNGRRLGHRELRGTRPGAPAASFHVTQSVEEVLMTW